MKRILILSLLSLIGFNLFGHNELPIVSNVRVELDLQQKMILVYYSIFDPENDSISVRLKSSTDGEFYSIVEDGVTGDAGDGIASGDKLIKWEYPPDLELNNVSIRLAVWDNGIIDVSEWVDEVSESILREHMAFIEGPRNYSTSRPHLEEVKDHIESRFNDAGLLTSRQDFLYQNQTGQNILGRKQGLLDETSTWIIDGHFDSVSNSPGADDNGSAVVGVLELVRVLGKYSFEQNLLFVGFDFEEAGLIGSQRYVQSGRRPFETIKGVYNMEMIGYYSDQPNSQQLPFGFSSIFPAAAAAVIADDYRGNFLTNVGNANSAALIASIEESASQYVPELRVISLNVPGTGTLVPDLRRSDHAPFWDAGVPALMLTDGANFRNLNYHTPGDSSATLNFTFMSRVIKTILAAVATQAKPIHGFHVDAGMLTSTNQVHNHTKPKVSLTPNPAENEANLRILGSPETLFHLKLMTLDGKVLFSTHTRGNSDTLIPLEGLSAGTYLVLLDSPELSISRELLIKK
jgi:hypothetical protein